MAKAEKKPPRKRSANWDEDERVILKECLLGVLDIVENKCTDTNTNKAKNLAWQKVTRRFNELNDRSRSLIELRQQWRTIKLDAKRPHTHNSTDTKVLQLSNGSVEPPNIIPKIEVRELSPEEFEEGDSKDTNESMQNNDTMQDSTETAQANDIHILPESIVETEMENYNLEYNNVRDGSTENTKIPVAHTSADSKKFIFESVLSSQCKRCKFEEERVSKSTKFKNMTHIRLMQEEHNLKITQMVESHRWAQVEHNLRLENLRLQNLLLQKQLNKD